MCLDHVDHDALQYSTNDLRKEEPLIIFKFRNHNVIARLRLYKNNHVYRRSGERVDAHQRRRYKRLKGAELGLKTERSRNPPLTRSTRALLRRVIGSFELLKEALARIHPPRCFFLSFPPPLFLPVFLSSKRAHTSARLPLSTVRGVISGAVVVVVVE